MSFMSASEIFEPVTAELVNDETPGHVVYSVTRELIKALVERGWDDVEGSVALFENRYVWEAANDLGFVMDSQLPRDGTYGKALVRCQGCGRPVRYRLDEEHGPRSEVHAKISGGATMDGSDLCAFSNRNPRGY